MMLLTTKEAGRRLNLSARAVHWLVDAGLLPAQRTAQHLVLVSEEGLERLALTRDDVIRLIRDKVTSSACKANGGHHGNDQHDSR